MGSRDDRDANDVRARLTARQFVFRIFSLLTILAAAIIATLICTVFLRATGFALVDRIVNGVIPLVARAVQDDPGLLVAFVIAALLVWSFPWEGFSQEKPHIERETHRRGRQVHASKDANQRAYQELIRRHAAKHKTKPRTRPKNERK